MQNHNAQLVYHTILNCSCSKLSSKQRRIFGFIWIWTCANCRAICNCVLIVTATTSLGVKDDLIGDGDAAAEQVAISIPKTGVYDYRSYALANIRKGV